MASVRFAQGQWPIKSASKHGYLPLLLWLENLILSLRPINAKKLRSTLSSFTCLFVLTLSYPAVND